ncbi:unnamed protein product [Prorocentrum cordatum]|uniref:Uncharacterized protein n=1 Tax=Prorocentrum cordatum TaxID=2364126 RepID=A0ABN9QWL0_9DINO|nr:unnamed protein product [Polarella glacialis]
MAPRPTSRNGDWACTGCNAQSGDGYDVCWKCWKGHDCAKLTRHGTTHAQDDTGADDVTKARLKTQRGHLADLRRQAADPDLAPHAQGIISTLQKEVGDWQAAVEAGSDAPRCFSERKLARERNKTQGQRDRTRERVEKQELEIMEAQGKLDNDIALLARQEEKPQKHNTRIEELSAPTPGQGWSAAAAFLEQASKCLRDREADPELSEEGGQGFIAVTANSIGTLERTMRSTRYTNKFPAIIAQELQANERSISCFTQRIQKEGWRRGTAPSARAASGGWSAGALLATARPNSMSYAKGLDTWDISPRGSKGRLAIGWVDAHGKQCMTIGAAYLWVSEGMTCRSRAILRSFNAAAMAAGKHWILGGGFNMGPAELQQTRVINRMEGTIVFDTSRGSCVSSGEAGRRDYFIISKSLMDGALQVAVQDQHAQEEVDRYWSDLANTYEEHLNKYFNYDGLEWHERKGHMQAPTYAWEQMKPPKVREAAREQQWADAAEWLGRRLELICTAVRAWGRNGKQETLSWAQCNAKGILEQDIIEPLLERRHPAWSGEADQEGAAEGHVNVGNIDGDVDTDTEGEHDSVGTEDNADDLDEINEAARRVEEDGLSLPEFTPRHPAAPGPGASQDCPLVGAEAAGERRPPTGRGHWADIDWGKLVNTIAWIDTTNITERGLLYVECVAKPMTVASQHTRRRVRRKAARGWRRWVAKHSQAGAGALRKWTMPPVPWEPIKPTGNYSQQELTHPQVAADAAPEGWETAWAAWAGFYDDSAPWCRPPSDDEWGEYAAPRITPRGVIEARGRFRAKTGLGEADWHPRLWRHGGFQGAARVASVLGAVERGAPWPTTEATMLFYLTPRAAGGFRNLGLMPELARAWETIRVPCARRWEAANQRAYDWARRGRSSERAAWLQALYGEAARAEGHEYAMTYFGLVKCFEWVTHLIMHTVLKIYGMVRRIVLDGCYAEGRAWQRGIVAGSRYAPLCLKMVVILNLGELVHQFPQADTRLFLDDLAKATHGISEFVHHFHPQLVAAVVHMFEVKLDMAVSKGAEGKTVTLTSSTALGKRISAHARHLGARVVKHEKHLGVTGGAAHKLIRQASVPALLYGSSIVGTADSKLKELRRNVATAMERNTEGKSTALTLLSDRIDPGILANSGPTIAWATAWQEALDDAGLADRLHSAWRTWVMKIYKCKAPWLTVRGPAGAFVATVKRLGWVTQAAHSVTIDGTVFDLRFTMLQEIQHHAIRTTEQQLKDEWVEQYGRQYGITSLFVEPARLHAKGAAPDSTCRACGRGHGTDRHRAFACPARQQHRSAIGGLRIQRRGANPWPGPGAEVLWGRGIMADPAVELKHWDLETCDGWPTEGNWDGLATGDIYVDGSLQYGHYPALRRGGWSFTKLKDNDEHDMEYVCCGPLPGAQWTQSILRAELYAVLQALTAGAPPM